VRSKTTNREKAMRQIALALLTVGASALLAAAAPAGAQTYAPPYPVCLHVYGPITYYECGYTSIPQCNASASGRSAQCVVNPYVASAGIDGPSPRLGRRHYVY
jgi:Protein of unknown function (DUF3551)